MDFSSLNIILSLTKGGLDCTVLIKTCAWNMRGVEVLVWGSVKVKSDGGYRFFFVSVVRVLLFVL